MCFWARLGGAENWNRILREHLEVKEKMLEEEGTKEQPGTGTGTFDD